MNVTHKLDEVATPEMTAKEWDDYLHRCGPGGVHRGTVRFVRPGHDTQSVYGSSGPGTGRSVTAPSGGSGSGGLNSREPARISERSAPVSTTKNASSRSRARTAATGTIAGRPRAPRSGRAPSRRSPRRTFRSERFPSRRSWCALPTVKRQPRGARNTFPIPPGNSRMLQVQRSGRFSCPGTW
jgi:hypothetical protein